MRIGIDIDATITMYPEFFRALTEAMYSTHEIHVITDRDPAIHDQTVEELQELGIRYHHLVITPDKYTYILDQGIDVLFDDTDHYFQELPEAVAVFKVRGHYNFNYATGRWIYTDQTGEQA